MGFGTSPAGTFPAGFAAAAEAAAPPDPSPFVRAIDPASRDYTIDATTRAFTRTTATRQRVQLALSTLRESSTVQRDWGVLAPRKMSRSFEQEADASVREALAALVRDGSIEIVTVGTKRGTGGRAQAVVTFRDRTTGEILTEPVING
jgi:hypothetical protein